ncbi:MAG TPA: translation initiation factor IF-3 [Candidatus Latescibacteria bacterium]|nr:translation initiation factor IF-3 [Candidatus Latescibacterota bacterium]
MKRTLRVNEQIRVPKVRVVAPDGSQVGIMDIRAALRLAEEYNLDLVEVSPNSHPPVCRIMDYGKYRYEQAKREREARKKQHTFVVKEIRLRPITEDHDFHFKMRHARNFLQQGNKVRITVRFRGRERGRHELGYRMLERALAELADVGSAEGRIEAQEGGQITITLAPKAHR